MSITLSATITESRLGEGAEERWGLALLPSLVAQRYGQDITGVRPSNCNSFEDAHRTAGNMIQVGLPSETWCRMRNWSCFLHLPVAARHLLR